MLQFRSRSFRFAWLAGALLAGIVVSGCATVQPWQRGTLSKAPMMFDPDPARAAYDDHWMTSREGAAGGFGLQGGGCGCK
jgi:hypothetical protein